MDETPKTKGAHGGARQGAGRPAASRNKAPSKSLQARERLAELIEPHLELLVTELLRMALNGEKDQDRLRAIQEAFNRAAGKAPDTIEINTGGAAPASVADLLAGLKEASGD